MVSQQWEKVMSADLGAMPTETGSRASAKPASGLVPSGFDPARMADPWHQMVADACRWAVEQSRNGRWFVSGEYADLLGSQALQLVADTVGVRVIPTGGSDYHNGKTFTPAIATEARRAETTGSVHEGAGRKASPKPNHIGETNDR